MLTCRLCHFVLLECISNKLVSSRLLGTVNDVHGLRRRWPQLNFLVSTVLYRLRAELLQVRPFVVFHRELNQFLQGNVFHVIESFWLLPLRLGP